MAQESGQQVADSYSMRPQDRFPKSSKNPCLVHQSYGHWHKKYRSTGSTVSVCVFSEFSPLFDDFHSTPQKKSEIPRLRSKDSNWRKLKSSTGQVFNPLRLRSKPESFLAWKWCIDASEIPKRSFFAFLLKSSVKYLRSISFRISPF